METKIKDGQKYVKTRDGKWVLANPTNPFDLRSRVASEGDEGKKAKEKAKREKAGFGTERFTKNKVNVPKADASRFNRNTKSNKGAFGGGSYGDYVKSDKTKTKTNYSFKEGLKINKKKEDGSSLSSTKETKRKGKKSIMIGGKKASATQKRLLKSGFSAKELEGLQKKHKEWKKNRGK